MGFGGKGPRKSFLQINTDIDEITFGENLTIDDRIRPGAKKKGSLGVERYEVYLKNENEVYKMFETIKEKIKQTSSTVLFFFSFLMVRNNTDFLIFLFS